MSISRGLKMKIDEALSESSQENNLKELLTHVDEKGIPNVTSLIDIELENEKLFIRKCNDFFYYLYAQTYVHVPFKIKKENTDKLVNNVEKLHDSIFTAGNEYAPIALKNHSIWNKMKIFNRCITSIGGKAEKTFFVKIPVKTIRQIVNLKNVLNTSMGNIARFCMFPIFYIPIDSNDIKIYESLKTEYELANEQILDVIEAIKRDNNVL